MSLGIRDAAPGDEAQWRRLWRDYLDYYGVTLAPGVADRTWARILDADCSLSMRVAVTDRGIVGFAIYLAHESSWSLAQDCYLEDLFVSEAARGRGIGRALIEDVIALARSRGYSRLYWMADQENATARALYDRFAETDNHIRYRMTL
ncbi:GNAT family N-acetyltransferase [Ostreiculturibacter nitratireducens]|uniref:GNAT family N-acetyltransferase n=1 Tax=Ostreiculturibacter nitratireducens TaxID=3075226 RepID=UPI0031B5A490